MKISDLTERFSISRRHKIKAIFASLFILQNRLQTLFDQGNPSITLKQFMLLVMVRQSGEALTLTQCGELLGCSRQNIKKLAAALERKGLVEIHRKPDDSRAAVLQPTPSMQDYFQQAARFHEQALDTLFCDYTDQEIDGFFSVLTKLYQGTARLEAQSAAVKAEERTKESP